MPVFKFNNVPTDAEFNIIITAFDVDICDPTNHRPRVYTDEILNGVYARLNVARNILLRCYHQRNWKKCIPVSWSRSCVLKVLRHILHTRGFRLESKVVRHEGVFMREYSIVNKKNITTQRQCIASIVSGRKSILL